MLQNYLKIALRNLRRQKGYTIINIFGLALGLACCLVIGLYVQDEFSYDRHHANGERIFRVSQDVNDGDRDEVWAWTGGAMGERLQDDFGLIDEMTRILPNPTTITYQRPDGQIVSQREEGFAFADANWFDVFTHTFHQGNPQTALATPQSLVLTASAATRYFGGEDPMGKSLNWGSRQLTVTAVIADIPRTSHGSFTMLAPVAAFKLAQGLAPEDGFGSFWWPFSYTYVMLRDAEDARTLSAEMLAFIERHRSDDEAYLPILEPLHDIHLYSEATQGPSATGNIDLVRIFSVIALVVLLLACINFMNLSTARAAKRAREVGVRKSIGANQGQLIRQFLGEAMLLSLSALALALALVELFLPLFNDLAGRTLTVDYIANGPYWLALLALVLITGLVSGLYPAFYLARFEPADVLKGSFQSGRSGTRIRQGLVVFQFAISVLLMTCTLIAANQLNYLQNARLGFDQEEVVQVRLTGGVDYDLLKNELRQQPDVLQVTSARTPLGLGPGSTLPYRVGSEADEMAENAVANPISHNQVGYDFIDQFGLQLLAGRGFSRELKADVGVWPEDQQFFHLYERAFLVNEATARANGWTADEALGKRLRIFAFENGTYYTDLRGTIVGVLEDFHFSSLRNEISPMAFSLTETPRGHIGGFALVKVQPGDVAAAMATVESVWRSVAPDQPFDASFLDQNLQNMYDAEARLSSIILVFTLLGMVIACLGLVGLATFAAERRTKEIGVRKVMGASVTGLIGLLSVDFMKLVALAFVIAAPVAYLIMREWLSGFAYHIAVGPDVFLLTGGLAFLIAFVSVSYQAYRAASANPVRSLRYE